MVAVTETALQFAFEEFLKVVVAQDIQSPRFNALLKRLKNTTLQSIQPVFYETQRLSNMLDCPDNKTIRFISYLKRGKRLVLRSSRLTFLNDYQKMLHSYKLIRLNNELVRFFQTESQVEKANAMKMPIEFDNLEDKVAQLLPAFTTHVSVGSNWNLEELKLDISIHDYSIPESVKKMGQLNVLSITGHSDYPSKLHNLSLITSLTCLTTLRFEHVSVASLQPIIALKKLKQLSFVMCEIGNALMSITTESPYNMLPNLTHLEIDMCYDLKELPSGLCNLVNLRNLSITNCHELDVLPEGLGDLSNLESLSLHWCTKLQELPESIGSLRKLDSIDISDCLSISVLPEEIGELHGLRVLKMNGCTGLQELPVSTSELSQLKEVMCDEETSYLWMDFESDLHNLKINVVEDDRLETFMKIVH